MQLLPFDWPLIITKTTTPIFANSLTLAKFDLYCLKLLLTSQILTPSNLLLNLLNDNWMHVFQRSLFLYLPSIKVMILVRVTRSFYLLIDTHKFDGLLHLGQTRPVLNIRLRTRLFGFKQLPLVNTPNLLIGQGTIYHQYLRNKQLRPLLMVASILILSSRCLHWDGLGGLDNRCRQLVHPFDCSSEFVHIIILTLILTIIK